MKFFQHALAIGAALMASIAHAEPTLSACEGPASFDVIIEPWEEHTRTFANVAGTHSSYDPGKGLLLSVPVERYIDGIRSTKLIVDIRINQATGSVTIE